MTREKVLLGAGRWTALASLSLSAEVIEALWLVAREFGCGFGCVGGGRSVHGEALGRRRKGKGEGLILEANFGGGG